MFSSLFKDVPLSVIRHNDLPCYHKEGYGGRPIQEWPMYKFYKEYAEGETERATQHFSEWYHEQLQRYEYTPKTEGGMYKGSLYTLIEKMGKSDYDTVSDAVKDNAIRQRVSERFQLLENIRDHGYDSLHTEPIHAIRRNGFVYPVRGHHRAAVLQVLGKEVLPHVLVFPNQFIYNLVRFLRNIKHGNFHK